MNASELEIWLKNHPNAMPSDVYRNIGFCDVGGERVTCLIHEAQKSEYIVNFRIEYFARRLKMQTEKRLKAIVREAIKCNIDVIQIVDEAIIQEIIE